MITNIMEKHDGKSMKCNVFVVLPGKYFEFQNVKQPK